MNDWNTAELIAADPSLLKLRRGLGARICFAARNDGLLTRPIRNVIVLMPSFCITRTQLKQAVDAIGNGIISVCERAN